MYIRIHRWTSASLLLPLSEIKPMCEEMPLLLPLPFQPRKADECVSYEVGKWFLVRFYSGNVRREKGKSQGGGSFLWGGGVLHQRLDMPFSQRMNISQLPVFCLFSNPPNPALPSAQTSYQSAKTFAVRMKDAGRRSFAHLQEPWFLFACPKYRAELIDIRVVWMRRQLNASKAEVCFLFHFHRKHLREGWEESMQSTLFNHGQRVWSAWTSLTAATDANVVVILIWKKKKTSKARLSRKRNIFGLVIKKKTSSSKERTKLIFTDMYLTESIFFFSHQKTVAPHSASPHRPGKITYCALTVSKAEGSDSPLGSCFYFSIHKS